VATNRDCQYCGTRFRVELNSRLFCSGRCRQRYHRENRLKCFYCGELGTSRDHIFAHSARINVGRGTRNFAGQETVNSCDECNNIMGNRHPYSILDRVAYLIERLDARYQLQVQVPEWDEEELEELGQNLRRMIGAKIKQRQRALERRSHAKIVYDRINRLTHSEDEIPEDERDKSNASPAPE